MNDPFEKFIKKNRIFYIISMVVMSMGLLLNAMDLLPRQGIKIILAIGLFGILVLITLYVIDVIKESKK